VIFKEGDWIWLLLSKGRFPKQMKSKLNSRGEWPFRVFVPCIKGHVGAY